MARREISDNESDLVLETHQVDEARRDDQEHIALLKLRGTINGLSATMLVDSGASANFIDAEFVERNKIETCTGEARLISLADGSTHRSDQRLRDAKLIVGTHEEAQQFTVLPLKGQTAILGLPWLTKNDASIDWRKRRILVKKHDKMHTLCTLGDLITSSALTQNKKQDCLNTRQRLNHSPSDDQTRRVETSCNSASLAAPHASTPTSSDDHRHFASTVRDAEKTTKQSLRSPLSIPARLPGFERPKMTNQRIALPMSYAAALSAGIRTPTHRLTLAHTLSSTAKSVERVSTHADSSSANARCQSDEAVRHTRIHLSRPIVTSGVKPTRNELKLGHDTSDGSVQLMQASFRAPRHARAYSVAHRGRIRRSNFDVSHSTSTARQSAVSRPTQGTNTRCGSRVHITTKLSAHPARSESKLRTRSVRYNEKGKSSFNGQNSTLLPRDPTRPIGNAMTIRRHRSAQYIPTSLTSRRRADSGDVRASGVLHKAEKVKSTSPKMADSYEALVPNAAPRRSVGIIRDLLSSKALANTSRMALSDRATLIMSPRCDTNNGRRSIFESQL